MEDKEKCKLYDFKRPDKFSRDHLRTIQNIHEQFARLLSSELFHDLRIPFDCNVESVDQLTYEEFVYSVKPQSYGNLIKTYPLNGETLIHIDNNIMNALIDSVTGGKCRNIENDKSITPLGLEIIKNLSQRFMKIYTKCWKAVLKNIDFSINDNMSKILSLTLVAPEEMTVCVTINVKINEEEGKINLVLPFITIEPIINRLSSRYWYSTIGKKEIDNQLDIPGKYRIYNDFKYADLSIDEIINLKDVLPIDNNVNAVKKYKLESKGYYNLLYNMNNGEASKDGDVKTAEIDNEKIDIIKLIKFPVSFRFKDNIMEFSKEYYEDYKNDDNITLNQYENQKGELIIGNTLFSELSIINENDNIQAKINKFPNKPEDLITAYVTAEVEMGNSWIDLDEYKKMNEGSVIISDYMITEPKLLKINGVPYCYGDIVVSEDENFAFKITKILSKKEILKLMNKSIISDKPKVFARFILGKKIIKLHDLISMKEGDEIITDKEAGEPVDILINEEPKFNAEIMIMDDFICVRITNFYGEKSDTVSLLEEKGNRNRDSYEEDDHYNDREYKKTENFEFLDNVEIEQLVNILNDEYPQIISLILSYMKPDKSAKFIEKLDKIKQADIIERISNINSVYKDSINIIEEQLRNRINSTMSKNINNSMKIITKILNNINRESEMNIITDLEEKNPDLAQEIKDHLFVFEDSIILSDESIKTLIKEIEMSDLAKALKGVDSEVQEHYFKNMNEDMSSKLKNIMTKLGPIRLEEVEKAQKRIIEEIKRLEESKAIFVSRVNDEIID